MFSQSRHGFGNFVLSVTERYCGCASASVQHHTGPLPSLLAVQECEEEPTLHAASNPSWSRHVAAQRCHVDAVIRNWIVFFVPPRFRRIAGGCFIF